MPNPSNVAADLHAQRDSWLRRYKNLRLSKATREAALAEVRRLEDELDLPEAERTPAHNGRPGGKHEQSPTDDGSLRLKKLIDAVLNISRDDDGDAMLDAEGLDELQALARALRQ